MNSNVNHECNKQTAEENTNDKVARVGSGQSVTEERVDAKCAICRNCLNEPSIAYQVFTTTILRVLITDPISV
jgi:hypothetical protein